MRLRLTQNLSKYLQISDLRECEAGFAACAAGSLLSGNDADPEVAAEEVLHCADGTPVTLQVTGGQSTCKGA